MAYGRIRQGKQDTAVYGRYGSIRQDTAGYGRIRQDTAGYGRIRRETAGYGRIRQNTEGYSRIRLLQEYSRIRETHFEELTFQLSFMFGSFCLHGVTETLWCP